MQEMLSVTSDVAGDLKSSDDDCFALCVMSHGQLQTMRAADGDPVRCECVLGTDGVAVPTASLLAPFCNEKCPPLRGKPRIVIFQACRGGTRNISSYCWNLIVSYHTCDFYRLLKNYHYTLSQKKTGPLWIILGAQFFWRHGVVTLSRKTGPLRWYVVRSRPRNQLFRCVRSLLLLWKPHNWF